MKTVKITAKRIVIWAGIAAKPGDVVQLPDDVADRLIAKKKVQLHTTSIEPHKKK